METTQTASTGVFQSQLITLFYNAWKVNKYSLRNASFWLKTIRRQKEASKIREELATKKVSVPPIMILSVTNKCNLNCKGCYALAQKRDVKKEMPIGRISLLFGEAEELGTRIIMIAGGEPLMRADLLRLAAKHKKSIFPVFTNGLLLKGENLELFKKNQNLIPVLSIEGEMHDTDIRRGEGVASKIEEVAVKLYKSKQLYGLSVTLTKDNFDLIMHEKFLNAYQNKGCKVFFFVEYVPQSEADINRCITPMQKQQLPLLMEKFRKRNKALYIALPGEEEQYGGCLAAGRGFVHISSSGDMEPCPFAPYSDANVMDLSLKDALKSTFLNDIRKEHNQLKESTGGCSLWENREWVMKKLNKSNGVKAKALA